MKFTPTEIEGVVIVALEPATDDRGLFARTFCVEEFAREGLSPVSLQCSISVNRRAGTLRGMHFQRDPHGEAKLVRCTRGAIHDVVVDLRPGSRTYRESFAIELRADGLESLFIAEGLAHGFQTLVDDTEVHYQMSTPYVPEAASGVRWDDPAFDGRWPDPPPGRARLISERDLAWPDLP